jgi:predicted phage terminase large subunit-like protein
LNPEATHSDGRTDEEVRRHRAPSVGRSEHARAVRLEYYVLDVVRRRVEYPDLRRMVEQVFELHHPGRLYVEDAANGTPLVQTLRRETRLPIMSVVPHGSKIARFEAVSGLLESRRVLLPEDAPWLDEFVRELLAFPGGRNDDQVDALTLALSRASVGSSTAMLGWLSNVRPSPITLRSF